VRAAGGVWAFHRSSSIIAYDRWWGEAGEQTGYK
jgi:hypothetical protein